MSFSLEGSNAPSSVCIGFVRCWGQFASQIKAGFSYNACKKDLPGVVFLKSSLNMITGGWSWPRNGPSGRRAIQFNRTLCYESEIRPTPSPGIQDLSGDQESECQKGTGAAHGSHAQISVAFAEKIDPSSTCDVLSAEIFGVE